MGNEPSHFLRVSVCFAKDLIRGSLEDSGIGTGLNQSRHTPLFKRY